MINDHWTLIIDHISIKMRNVEILQGDFFDWSLPKSSKCWRWQNPYQKSESKGVSHRTYENLTQTFTFLVGFLPSPTLRTFRVGPFEKNTLYVTQQFLHYQLCCVSCYCFSITLSKCLNLCVKIECEKRKASDTLLFLPYQFDQ